MAVSRWLQSVTSGLVSKPEPLPEHACHDCGRRFVFGGVSVPVHGVRWFCHACASWRSAHLVLFDVRSRQMLEREVA